MTLKKTTALAILLCLLFTSEVKSQRIHGPTTQKVLVDIETLHQAFLARGHHENEWIDKEIRRFRYIWIPCPADLAEEYDTSLRFILNSFSQQHIIERAEPVRIETGDPSNLLYRIDLVDLLWTEGDLIVGLRESHYPYSHKANPLILRGDYLINTITDEKVSDLGPFLLFGRANVPQTDVQFAKFFGFEFKDQDRHNFGLVEEDSGVSVSGVRLITYYDAPFGYWWQTEDFKILSLANNPIDNLDRENVQGDGTEIIAGFQKISTVKQKTGATQLYMLVNKENKRVREAPNDLVTDKLGFKGTATIRNSGSCMQCHPGLNIPHRDAIQRLIADGIEIWGTEERRDDIERFHLSDIAKTLKRNNEDFATFVFMVNGLDPQTNITALKFCFSAYEEDVTLDQAARELECLPLDLQRAVAFASQRKIKIGTTLADLVDNGKGIPRSLWQELYVPTLEMVETWRKINSVPVPVGKEGS